MAIIEVKHLTKEYQLGSVTSIKDNIRHTLAKIQGKETWEREKFKALDDVSFSIEEGEVVGIIGHNGAGKSTLLKHLANISKPTKGEVVVRGSIAPLIEVGAGVNPELTGRENIFLNGAILGIPKKIISRKLDEIIEFSELEQFIDTPVKRYSSGMTVKLGFSIATSMDADILIIDEVLAVGDLAFQRKCFNRMEKLIKQTGRTVLLVSHNIRQIQRICNRVLLLDHGKILIDGEQTETCEEFYRQNNTKITEQATTENSRNIRSSGEINLASITLLNQNGEEVNELSMNDPVTIRCEFDSIHEIQLPEVVVGFHTTDFFYVASMGNTHLLDRPNITKGKNNIECSIKNLPLMPGTYALRFAVLDNGRNELFHAEQLNPFTVNSGIIPQSTLPSLGIIHIPVEWSY